MFYNEFPEHYRIREEEKIRQQELTERSRIKKKNSLLTKKNNSFISQEIDATGDGITDRSSPFGTVDKIKFKKKKADADGEFDLLVPDDEDDDIYL